MPTHKLASTALIICFPHGLLRSQLLDSEPLERSNLPEPSSRVLEGYHFTLTALAGDKEEGAYRRVIWQARGRCFDRHTIALVDPRERAYALCPVSLTKAAKDRLKEQHPDMALGEHPRSCLPCRHRADAHAHSSAVPLPLPSAIHPQCHCSNGGRFGHCQGRACSSRGP